MPKRLSLLLLMVLLLACAPALTVQQFNIMLPFWLSANLTILIYLSVLLGLTLCWFFYNSREFILLLILVLCVWALQNYLWQGNLPSTQKSLLFNLITFLLPLNFLLINFLSERGLWNQYGLRRIGFVIIQLATIAWLVHYSQEALVTLLGRSFLAWPVLEKTNISQVALLSIFSTVMLLLFYSGWRPNQLQTGRLLSLITIIAGLHFVHVRELSLLYFLLAVVILIIVTVINAFNLAYRDELTQLPSRRALRQQLMALGKSYTLAMVDVDHFKKLNDTYGHDVGDDVLKLLAAHLQKVMGGGKAFRYGGEEFTIVFPGKLASEAKIYLEALRDSIATTPFVVRHKKRPRKKPEKQTKHTGTKQLKVTVSIGVAEKKATHKSPQEVIKIADNALYKAKKGGRNRVVISR